MALDLERLKKSVAIFDNATPEQKLHYALCGQFSTDQLREGLPALCDSDLAAVAYYVAGIVAAIRDEPLWRLSDVVGDTAVGYTLSAAKLIGMI